MIIFSVAITILAFAWSSINTQLSLSTNSGSTVIQLQAQTLAETLLSQGSPANWESLVNSSKNSTWSNVSIGLGSATTNISSKKLYAFMAMANDNYKATKPLLGIGYDYYILIYNNNLNITIGHNPFANKPLTVDVVTKSSYLNGEPVTVQVMVWTNTPFGVS